MNMQLKTMLVGGAFFLAGLMLPAQTVRKLYIYHTNDTHSTIEPIAANYPDTALAGKAGAVRRATLLKRLRAEHGTEQILLFDSGDFSQGSPYYALFKGDVEIDLMNAMGYDACTIGNHEFDGGLENMARLFRKAKFPVVCANYHFEGTPLEGLVKPYVILHRGGLKIGVFGLGPELDGLVFSEYYQGVVYEDALTVGVRTAAMLKKNKHCDLVICLSHLGWEGPISDKELMEHTGDIDIVLGGHSHTDFDKPIFYHNAEGVVVVQQMGKYGRYLGWLEIDYERK